MVYHTYLNFKSGDKNIFKFEILDKEKNLIERWSEVFSRELNSHQGHYASIILALKKINKMNMNINSLHIYSCGQVVIRQLNGEYSVKAKSIKKLYQLTGKLVEESGYKVFFHWKPKEKVDLKV